MLELAAVLTQKITRGDKRKKGTEVKNSSLSVASSAKKQRAVGGGAEVRKTAVRSVWDARLDLVPLEAASSRTAHGQEDRLGWDGERLGGVTAVRARGSESPVTSALTGNAPCDQHKVVEK